MLYTKKDSWDYSDGEGEKTVILKIKNMNTEAICKALEKAGIYGHASYILN